MYTLVYLNGNFNRPDTLTSFLQTNVGNDVLLQIDCVTPYQGTADELVSRICEHLNKIDPMIAVGQVEVENASIETAKSKQMVHFMVIQVRIDNK